MKFLNFCLLVVLGMTSVLLAGPEENKAIASHKPKFKAVRKDIKDVHDGVSAVRQILQGLKKEKDDLKARIESARGNMAKMTQLTAQTKKNVFDVIEAAHKASEAAQASPASSADKIVADALKKEIDQVTDAAKKEMGDAEKGLLDVQKDAIDVAP